ncbi:NAD(P)/FAD-dependent oxidoreductase [Dinghuibacter silviterrae]|uniref:NAD(P)/FAD-dependent oxidoreductase n=1 Tax=Dinghuibacter silviterrae TaxID=1539049 RepID=UPI001B87916A|nr:FAD-dependent monooxygenase [Dinghuibacter silviterrae]
MPYQVALIGGGLAGLSLSITLAQKGYRVIVFEKETYPLHRVCGEYVSMESHPFLERLGLSLDAFPRIHTLTVTAPDGYTLTHPLDMGGFGISRYTLDALLAGRAVAAGVTLRTGCTVTAVAFDDSGFMIEAGGETTRALAAVGSFGKRSNLDVRMQRPFVQRKDRRLDNFIGVKYHIRVDLPPGQIALHNFRDGYCGVSAVENGLHCLCYLTTAANLKRGGGSIRQMEENILCANPHLRALFTKAHFEWDKPVTIAQISFAPKDPVEGHLLMVGDAAGLISPLCGNGMSMAFRAGQLAEAVLIPFLRGDITRAEMEKQYRLAWNMHFSNRLKAGRLIQSLFGKPWTTKLFLKVLKPFPILTRGIIRKTHGNAF